jgi:hypothetical protein
MARCLKRELDERYASAAELRADLLAMKKPRAEVLPGAGRGAVLLLGLAFLAGLLIRRPAARPRRPRPRPRPRRSGPEALVIPMAVEVKPAGALLKIRATGPWWRSGP